MVDSKMIEEVKKRLVKTYNPLAIYIFGSYAWGTPNEESDLDLVVVVDKLDQDKYKTLVNGHKALMDLDLSKDILVFTKEEFEQRAQDKTTLCFVIKRKGKQLYPRA